MQLSGLPKEVMWRVIQFVDESHRVQCKMISRRWQHFGLSRGNSSSCHAAGGGRSCCVLPNELLVGLVLQFLGEPDDG